MSSSSSSSIDALQAGRRLSHRYRTAPSARRAALLPPGARARTRNVLVLGVFALALFVGRYWYAAAPLNRPEVGISFSCRQARYLLGDGVDCPATLAAIVDGLGARHVRLSLYWDESEPQPGIWDFSAADALVVTAATHGADVLLTVGIKAQRYPEIYLPSWLDATASLPEGAAIDSLPGVRPAALSFVRAAVEHYAANRAVVAWQVENEPFIKNFQTIHGWTVSPTTVAAEAEAVRQSDPLHRPIVVTHSAWTIYDQAWKTALALGDVLGENVFTKKAWIRPWWYFFPYEAGPFTPNLPGQARAARRAGKQLWLTELQAEPEEQRSLLHTLDGSAGSMTPASFAAALTLARRSGADRVYLWGAEWLYAVRTTPRGARLWQEARAAISAPNAAQGSSTPMYGSPR